MYSAVGGIPPAALTAFGASLTGTQLPTPVPDWQKLLLGLFLAFGTPETVTVTSASVTPATGSVSIVISGSVTYRLLFFIPFTQAFTIRTSVAIAPSGDGLRTDRIVSVVPTGTTLTLVGTPAAIPIPFNMLNGTLTNMLEPLVNRAIVNTVDGIFRARNPPMRRTPTCVISARRIGIGASGITAQIMLADFGPAIVPLPRTLALSVTPAPVPNTTRAYTFHVEDKSSHDPVAGATVAVTNQSPSSTQSGVTDAHGDVTFTLGVARADTWRRVPRRKRPDRPSAVCHRDRAERAGGDPRSHRRRTRLTTARVVHLVGVGGGSMPCRRMPSWMQSMTVLSTLTRA